MRKAADILYQKPFLLFLLFVLTAYLPALLPYFHLKNDILTQNLPTRFVFGESIYSGYEPFWNPYLNYGTPQYGDMNNGFWNPIQWLIGSTTGYNIYTITIEEVFYILIGGWGIYKASGEFFRKEIAIITALAYMCTGYITGHMQYLCWITGIGYFPYVLLYFIRINKNPILRNFIAGGISVFLFVASTHPGLIIGAAYFFLFFLLFIYFNRNSFLKDLYHRKFILINVVFLIISSLFSIVVIISNTEVLSHIYRGNKVSLEQTLWHPTTIQAYISLYLPLAVHKSEFFNTDIGMRNMFIGLLPFAGLFFAARLFKWKQLLTVLLPLTFFILLSAGSHFKVFAWKYLPLLGYVRLNGEFSYFTILILLGCGAAGLQILLSEENKEILIKKLLTRFIWATAFISLTSLTWILISKQSILFSSGLTYETLKKSIKSIIDNISIWDLIVLQACIHILTLLLLKKLRRSFRHMLLLFSINLVIITWLTMPFTGLGTMSKKEIQSIINKFPRGINPQPLVSINNADYIQPADPGQFLLIGSYSKKIGSILPDQYPVQLNSNASFIADTALYSFVKKQSFIFLSGDTINNTSTTFDSSYIHIINSGPGNIKCTIHNDGYKWLTLLQNNYPYWSVKVNNKPVPHYTGFKTFISLPVENGKYTVEFSFAPQKIKTALWVNILIILAGIIMAAIPRLNKLKLFR
jgi:hypothetical protein